MPRLLLVASAAAVLAVSTTACNTIDPAAATVNGTVITQRRVEGQLRDLVKAKAAIGSTAAAGASAGTASADFARQWVDQLVRLQLVHDEVTKRQLAVTADDRTTGQAEAEQLFQVVPAADAAAANAPTSVLDAMPKTFRDDLSAKLAEEVALGHALATAPVTSGVVHDVIKNGRDLICLRVLPVASPDEATSVLGQLATGADMAQLADKQFAGVAGAPKGGLVLGNDGNCPAIGQLNQTLAGSLGNLEIGKATGPITFGTNLLIMRVEQVQVEPLAQFLIAAQKTAAVTIDPRYGRFDPDAGVVAVDAPATTSVTTG